MNALDFISTSHFGRSFSGPGHLEGDCPCHKAACGLVDGYSEDCLEHNPAAGKTIRVSHLASQCTATTVRARFTTTLAYCDGCQTEFANIDGCPNCRTSAYLRTAGCA